MIEIIYFLHMEDTQKLELKVKSGHERNITCSQEIKQRDNSEIEKNVLKEIAYLQKGRKKKKA